MVLVQTSNTVSSTISLSCAIISFFACSAVVLSIYFYQQKKNSYHLQLVGRLLFSDLFLSCCIIFYYVIQYALNTSQLRQFCKLYLPLVLFSFLSSFAWTIMLALRFHTTQNIDSGKAYKPSKNLNHIWIGPAVLAALILIVSAITGDVTTVHTNDTDTNQACTFNHDTTLGVAMDLICFQIPMIFTILINIYYYSKGIFGIRNAPHSVIGRQMRRAGGYLGVLLLVTLPNLIYNMVTIFTGSENSYSSFLDLAVFLSSLQVICFCNFFCKVIFLTLHSFHF